MDKSQDKAKKCFCARCFLPVEDEDKVDIDGQNFHKICSMCCVCRRIPSAVKMFYGHVFCNECFKTHVLCRFKNDAPHVHSNSWWMQWAPGPKPPQSEKTSQDGNTTLPKRSICSRCLQPVDDDSKVEIGGQSFHSQCARCYFCHEIPTSKLKIYYGQVFCEDCFQRHVLNRGKDNPSDFFKHCFEHWQNNAFFAENMQQFMNGSRENAPFIFMMQGPQPPFCRCGTGPQEWFQQNEPKKSPATYSTGGESFGTCDISFEFCTEVSEIPSRAFTESANEENLSVTAAMQKIEKLTKYIQKKDYTTKNLCKKWKNFVDFDDKVSIEPKTDESISGWIDLQDRNMDSLTQQCPKCLWQCGPIYVNSDYLQNEIVCGDY
ncbi:Cysteine and glycine-rich protein 3 [Papilio machaon]|uniref:Cysteine and glycine-rich protein 3 n=1 Tax=Papilio machaon TaxID=76193 RepID=A0A0N1IJ44_PAPMA|nr:Cysteine and glycine-rich protein 3 [Papilio machaon]